MEYEVKQISNGDKRSNGDGSWNVPLTVVSGIVGDRPVDSGKAFLRTDYTTCIVLDTDTGLQMDAKAQAAAATLVSTLYPNT